MSSDKELEKLVHREFWDKRYEAESSLLASAGELGALGTYEWAKNFQDLVSFFAHHLPAPGDWHILHLGCGNSVRGPSRAHA